MTAPKLPKLPARTGWAVLEGPTYSDADVLAAMAQAAREQRERDAAICGRIAKKLLNEARPSFAMVEQCASAIRSQLEPVAQEGQP